MKNLDVHWLYPLKRRILFGILSILALTIIATTAFIFLALRNGLDQNSRLRTQELGRAIQAGLKSLMVTREPDRIQDTLEGLTGNKDSIVKAFILDKHGRIIYSTERAEIGRVLDRFREKSCRTCHQRIDTAPPQDTIIIDANGSEIYRNVMVIYNERPCYRCHAPSDRITGKLIIDRSLKDAYALITLVELIIFGSGIACLLLLAPFLSRVLSKGLDRYISEIISQHTELSLLYVMIERLSKTIDTEELKIIIFDVFREALEADEIDLVLPKDRKEFRAASWSRTSRDITRKKIGAGDPSFPLIARWLEGGPTGAVVAGSKREIFMPVAKAGVPLAFIVARRSDSPFKDDRLGLVEIMCSHIAVALENARLYHIAITDELTRLYTQRHFRSSIEKVFADFEKYAEKFTLLMLDIDDFKTVNDTYGHVVGDAILRDVAQAVQFSVRDNDLAFRYGGEEFTVLLPGTGPRGGRHVAERIRASVEAAVFEKGKHNIRLTISIGCATCPDTAVTVRDLILAADKRLYEAKKTGKNRVVGGEERS